MVSASTKGRPLYPVRKISGPRPLCCCAENCLRSAVEGTTPGESMTTINLALIDYALLLIYFGFVLGIGFALKRTTTSTGEFFMAGRSIPPWTTGLAFL